MDSGVGVVVQFGTQQKKLGQWRWGNTIATYSIDHKAIVQSEK